VVKFSKTVFKPTY